MKHLNKVGYSNKEISDFFNISNIKKVRSNDNYKPKDIWVGLKKYNQRLKRFDNNKVIRFKEGLYVEKIYD